ncbi:FAD dependent oxidoreductase [Rhodobacterales bacterium HTCC2150]|nr:FAD dependent oxidoreductase [Rhodobacterales bacterium HTCC2150] [Rhodobacteraceae bacterium HTCC2150]
MNDILIIGGGIAGISAAAQLSTIGKVTLLEAETSLDYHASGRSAAAYIGDYGNETVRALNQASEGFLRHQDGGVLSPLGMMILENGERVPEFLDEISSFKMYEMSPTEAQEFCPIIDLSHVQRVGYQKDVFHLDADLMMQRFRKSALSNGSNILTGATVTDIQFRSGKWHVHERANTHSADILVNAAGAWADQIARLAGVHPKGLQPFRRSIARVPAPGDHDVSTWPFLHATGEPWWAKPDAGKWIISPSEADPMDPFDAYADDMVIAEGLARYEPFVTEPINRVETTWAGLRTFAPDRSLIVGRDADNPQFVWAAGQGGYGFQTCFAVSQLLAELLDDQAPTLDNSTVTALSPSRFA